MLELKNVFVNAVNSIRVMGKFLPIRAYTLLAFAVLTIAEPTFAQTFDLPSVDIDGVDENTPVTEKVWLIAKFAVQFVLWALVIFSGVTLVKNILKSIAKARREEDGKWGEVAGEAIGNSVVVILIIALSSGVLVWLN